MNRRMIFSTVGWIVLAEALLLLPATLVALIDGDGTLVPFLLTVAVAAAVGGGMVLLSRPKNRVIYAREGFITVAVSWLFLSLIGCLPFVISRQIPSFVDAFFETVSGFTTTGASILTDVESLSRSVLFWRSFTHWIGGMGILVFIMALIPNLSDRSIHIMRAEMPGPVVGKLLPRAKDTAKILYLIYVVMTAIEVVMLKVGGMSLFDSLVHAFGTAGTGGFGIKADSIGSYSPYLQWVITAFMILFGVNFNLYYLLLIRRGQAVLKSTEMWTYFGILAVSTAVISVNILPGMTSVGEAIRAAAFQVASLVTTTGYATADFNLWPTLSRAVVFILLFLGGCAGSTAGGLKTSRVILLFKLCRREMNRLLHPREVKVVKMEGRRVEEETLISVVYYFAMYFICLGVIFLLLSFEPVDFETNLTATVSTFNNVGPGLSLVGPAGSYAFYSPAAKLLLSGSMLLGRLEIYPLLIALAPSAWRRK